MQKLVILVETLEDEARFDELWPQFLHFAERMPGLLRESTSRVDQVLYGKYRIFIIHELFFHSVEDIRKAMSTPEGRAAGEALQRMTAGRITLLLADHKEDDLENIRRHIHPDALADTDQ
jgi:uncharacterized protein (TIGR02118 family)